MVALLQSRLREEREKVEAQVAELGQNPVPAIELPEPAELLNQVKGLLGKKCGTTLRDMQVVVEIVRNSIALHLDLSEIDSKGDQ